MKPTEGVTAEIVVSHVRSLIERGELRPGDRLPPERELAVQLGVSRPSVRAGLRSLAAIGVLQTRHGAGTFITDGPPTLGSEPLSFLAALHGFTRDEMFEARRALEVGVAGLSAERATDEQIATIAEEVTGMFASLDDAQTFLIHDIRFHRAVAAASGNPILASLVEMVSALFYEQRKKTASNGRDLKQSAQAHRNIYHAIRAHDAKRARAAMSEHLSLAQQAQALEGAGGERRSRRLRFRSGSTRPRTGRGARRACWCLLPPPGALLQARRPFRIHSRAMPYAPLDLTGRAAVVIGGTSGIGRVLARALAAGRRRCRAHLAPRRPGRRGRRRHRRRSDAGSLRVPSDVNDRASLETLLAAVGRRVRQGRHHGQLRRSHQARADARPGRGRLERDHRDQPHRHAARGADFRPAHGGPPLRPHRQHRVAAAASSRCSRWRRTPPARPASPR